MELVELIEKIQTLSTSDRNFILQEIIKDEKVSVTEIILARVYVLEKFKQDARQDIVTVAQAGLELGEKEMRLVTGMGGKTRKKTNSFKLSMVKCLVDAGAFKGSKYGDELANIDYSAIDKKWYEDCWQPVTTKQELKR
jgi:hypothetical protein